MFVSANTGCKSAIERNGASVDHARSTKITGIDSNCTACLVLEITTHRCCNPGACSLRTGTCCCNCSYPCCCISVSNGGGVCVQQAKSGRITTHGELQRSTQHSQPDTPTPSLQFSLGMQHVAFSLAVRGGIPHTITHTSREQVGTPRTAVLGTTDGPVQQRGPTDTATTSSSLPRATATGSK